jgi:isoleucyl-tRNA synthetase
MKGSEIGGTPAGVNIKFDKFGRPQWGPNSSESSSSDGLICAHPFTQSASLVILGTHVTLDAGTGAVHTAPGHGQEDYIVSQNYGANTAPKCEMVCYNSEETTKGF